LNGSARAATIIVLVLLGATVLPLAPSGVGSAPVIRMSLTTDRFAYPLTGQLVVTVSVTNLEAQSLEGLTINTTVYDSTNKVAMTLPDIVDVEVGALSTTNFNVSATYSLADANYVIVSDATVGGTQVGSANVPLVVLSTEGRAPLTLAMVFHMHQPIYLNLKGQFEQPWVQIHSGGDFEYNGT